MAYLTLPRRIVTLLTMSTVIVSCTAEGILPPADIDGATRVGAISNNGQMSSPAQMQQQQSQPMPPMAMNSPSYQTYGQQQVLQAPQQQYGAPPTTLDAQRQQMGGATDSNSTYGASTAQSSEGINIDQMVGAGPRVVGLAQEQDGEIAETGSNQPIIGNIGSDAPMALNDGYQGNSTYGYPQASQAQMIPRRQVAPVEQRQPQQVAMLRPQDPTRAPEVRQPNMSVAPAMMPQSEVACRAELRRLGVGFKDVAAISNGGTCGIAYPIELSGLSGGVAVKPAVKLNCQVTLAFAKWVKFELNPSARLRYLSGVGRITPMGGYSCRKMNSRASNPWSEHARGNAIDIGTITLKNGNSIDVRKKSFFSFREKGLLKAVRTDSCKYFSTVLGPGSDPQHWNHFHFDLRTRKSGYRHCD